MTRGLVELTDETYDVAIASAKPMLVAFTAEWCIPSRQLLRELDDFVSGIIGFVTVGIVDVDRSPAIAARTEPVGLPLLKLYRGGIEVAEQIGAPKRRGLRSWVVTELGDKPR